VVGSYDSEIQESAPKAQTFPGIEPPFLRGLFDGMRCGILSIDRQGRVVVLNELARKVLDLEQAPEAGTPAEEALAAHPRLVQVLKDCFNMTRLPNREELVLGSGKTIGFTLSLVGGHNGQATGAALFFKDLTLIEQRAEQERLRDRLAALGQMAASLAHEIRNPLASIDVTCSLLRRRLGEDDGGRAMLDKITAEVRRLNRTITSSLEFVRPVSLQLAPATLAPLLDEAITVARERHGVPAIRIETDFRQDLPPIDIDRAQIRQVFENLILNSLEALGDSGNVTVVTDLHQAGAPAGDEPDAAAPWVQIQVRDDGPGLAQDERDKVFYPFFTTKEQGSGVGLSTAKKIVDCHRGQIDIEDAPGGGALFTVRLPVVHGAPED